MQTSLFQEIEEFTKCSTWIENQDSIGSSANDLFMFGFKSKVFFSPEIDSSAQKQLEAFSAIFERAEHKTFIESFDTQNQFDISQQSISNDKRTTLMIRNIPLNYTVKRLKNEIDYRFAEKYDYFNAPFELEGGFAFINFKNKKFLQEFFTIFNNRPWNFNKRMYCELKYAKVQYEQIQRKTKEATDFCFKKPKLQLYNNSQNKETFK